MLNVVDAEALIHDLPPADDTSLAVAAVVLGLAFVWGIVHQMHTWLFDRLPANRDHWCWSVGLRAPGPPPSAPRRRAWSSSPSGV